MRHIVAFSVNGKTLTKICKNAESAKREARIAKLPYRVYTIRGEFLYEGGYKAGRRHK